MPLRIVGVENPGANLQQSAAPMQKDIGVSDVTDQALQSAQKSQQQTVELMKQQTESTSQLARQEQVTASKSGDFLYDTVRAAGKLYDEYLKIDSKRQETQAKYNQEAQEERQKFNLANASQELRDSMTDVRNTFDKLGRDRGTEVVRQRFREIMLKYQDISPEAHKELTTYFYEALDDVDREQWNEGLRNRRELKEAQVSQATYDFKARQATRLANINNGPYKDNPEFVKAQLDELEKEAQTTATQMGFDELQSGQFKANTLRLIAENREESETVRAEAATKLKNLMEFQTKAAAITASGLPPDVQKKMLDAARLEHGQNGSTDPMTVEDVLKQTVERKRLDRQLVELEREGFLESGQATKLPDIALTEQALSFINDSSSEWKLEQMKKVNPLDYAQLKGRIDQINALVKNNRDAQGKVSKLQTSINQVQGKLQKIEAMKTMDAKALEALKKAGQDVDMSEEAQLAAQLQGLYQELNTTTGPLSQDLQTLANMGVIMDNNGTFTINPQSAAQLETAKQAAANRPQKQVNFNQGGAASQPTALKPVSDLGRLNNTPMPVLPGDVGKLTLSSPYGMRTHPIHGDQRLHNGVDLSGPTGTPVVAVRSGKVIRSEVNGSMTTGFGNYIEIEHSDGTVSGYAHLDTRGVKVGQVVPQGQKIGTIGSTGGSTGPHLHFSVYTSKTGSSQEPLQWLAKVQRESGSVSARGMGLPPQQGYTPNGAGLYRTNNESALLLAADKAPAGSLPMSTGGYIFQGRVYLPKGQFERMASYSGRPLGQELSNTANGMGGNTMQTNKQFNSKLPMVGTRASANIRDYGTITNDPTANYGYASLTNDKDFARALASSANRLGIPAVWLADIMAFESTYEGKTHNPRATNSDGAVGLIQFYPGGGLAEVAQEMRVNESIASDRLRSMTPAQQMRWVEFYLKNRIAETGKFTRMDDLFASIFGGTSLVRKSDQQRQNESDGQITYSEYLNSIGHHVGRKYHHGLLRGSDKPRTHTSYVNGCVMCSQMQGEGRFVTHKHTVPNTTTKSRSSTKTSSSGRSPLSSIRTGAVSTSKGYASRYEK